jgi:hypothetical protein
MENVLLIPNMAETVIDIHYMDLVDYNLKKEVAVFILGSFVYETANQEGERKFRNFIKEIPRFNEYLNYFLENGMLVRGKSKETYKYHHDVSWSRYLQPYHFDSIQVKKIILKHYPNLKGHIDNVFVFLEPNIKIT